MQGDLLKQLQMPWKTSGSSEIQGTVMLSRVSKTLDLDFSERKTQRRPVTGPPVAERQQEVKEGKEGAWLLGLTFPASFSPTSPDHISRMRA